MKGRDSIDQIDLKILDAIQSDGRTAIVDLAERVGLSKSPCLNRLRRLERLGYIRGYYADLDPHLLGQAYIVFVQVRLSNTTRATLEAFNQAARAVPQIVSCDMVAGGYDYLLKIRTKDMASYRKLLGEVLSEMPGVDQTATFPVMEQITDRHTLHIEPKSPSN